MFSNRHHRITLLALGVMASGLISVPAAAYEPADPAGRLAAERLGPAKAPALMAGPLLADEAEADEEGGLAPATTEEKVQAATVVGLDLAAPNNPLALNDRDFTFELWLKATAGTEVRGTGLLSLSDWDAEAQICIACTLYIRRGIHDAKKRDTDNEVRDRQTAAAAESRRQQAAELVEIEALPPLIASGDRDFTITLWNFLKREKPRFTASIAAAEEAFVPGATVKLDALLVNGLATAYATDQKRIIDEDTRDDIIAAAEAKRRFARKYAANVVGVNAKTTDDAWMTTTDEIFLRDLARILKGNSFWTLTYAALTDEVLNGTPESARRTIETGIFDLVERDRVRRNDEIRKVYSDFVRAVREDAIADGRKNVARAAAAALATNSIAKLWEFIEKRDTLPKDASDLLLLHKQGTQVAVKTRGEIGRWVASADRQLWKSNPDTWNFANARIASGDFDGDGKRDAVLLHWGATIATQRNLWWMSNVDGPAKAPASGWLSNADATTKKNYEFRSFAAGDFNGDGRSELAVYAKNKAGKSIILLLNKPGSGNWTATEHTTTDTVMVGEPTAGDVNNDGKEDLITIQQDATKGTQVWVALATATGFGTAAVKWSDPNFNLNILANPVAVDVDNNGFDELALIRQEKGTTTTNNGASLHLISNLHGTGTRSEKWRSPGGIGANRLAVVAEDVNGDDYTDLILHFAVVDYLTITFSMLNSAQGFRYVRQTAWHDLKTAELRIATS